MLPKNLDIGDVKGRKDEKQNFASKIGSHLRKIREGVGMTQEELSEKAGYYRTYIGKIEQGQYSPSLHTIWRISYILGYDLNKFFKDF